MENICWHSVFFLVMAALSCAFAVAVVLSSNIVRMALCLVLCLTAVAGLFFLAGADFVGAMQFMIYVGGTLVLLVFGVMLTARTEFVRMRTGAGQWIMAAILGAALLTVLLQAAFSVKDWGAPADAQAAVADQEPTATVIGMSFLGARVDRPSQSDATLARGMSGYLLPFEIVSVHLVVVLVGAAYLARARRRKGCGRTLNAER